MMSAAGELFITTDAVGGVWSYSLALARGMVAVGQACSLAVLGPAPTRSQREDASCIDGCRLIETGLPLEWRLNSRAALDRVIADLSDIAVGAQATAAHLHAPALAARRWPMPVVAVAHSCMTTWWDAVRSAARPPEIAWHGAATEQGLLAADATVAPSAAFAAALQHSYRLGSPVHVVHNGLQQPRSYRETRERFVLAAGRLWDPAKNIGVLDAAAATLQYPIRVAGPLGEPDGTQVRFCRLHALGNLDAEALGRLMARAAVFVAPSLYEPFGLAVLEAAQRGTPLILSDIPSFRELWSDAALFVPASDASAWVAAIDRLMGDTELRHRLGKAAAARSRHYTIRAMVERTIEIHRALARCEGKGLCPLTPSKASL